MLALQSSSCDPSGAPVVAAAVELFDSRNGSVDSDIQQRDLGLLGDVLMAQWASVAAADEHDAETRVSSVDKS